MTEAGTPSLTRTDDFRVGLRTDGLTQRWNRNGTRGNPGLSAFRPAGADPDGQGGAKVA